MSIIAMTWVRAQELAGIDKSILMVLAESADDEHSCGLTHERISRLSGYSVRTVKRHLNDLQSRGLLRWETRARVNRMQLSNRYIIPVSPEIDWTWRIDPDASEDEVPRVLGVQEAIGKGLLVGHSGLPLKQDETRTTDADVSAMSGLSGGPEWPTSKSSSTSTNNYLSLTDSKESITSSMTNRPVRHDMSRTVRRESSRARHVRNQQEENDQDPLKIVEAKIGESLSPGTNQSDLEVESQPRPEPQPQRKPKRKTPGPDTVSGLIDYWNTKLGLVEWGSALDDTNISILSRTFSRWKKNGASGEQIRSMIDLYTIDSGMRTPGTIPWKDFQNKRALLWERIQKTENSRTMTDHRNDPSYWQKS